MARQFEHDVTLRAAAVAAGGELPEECLGGAREGTCVGVGIAGVLLARGSRELTKTIPTDPEHKREKRVLVAPLDGV